MTTKAQAKQLTYLARKAEFALTTYGLMVNTLTEESSDEDFARVQRVRMAAIKMMDEHEAYGEKIVKRNARIRRIRNIFKK